ncbi:hypothetical protein [Actinotalea subterranea]|uniref:hypothetical protein n=1 Tax=Actinotalea subterranea TaxID=2607497 RepID=UPI0011F00103|nr:hypothetical protein [Actinotalea subterranea]
MLTYSVPVLSFVAYLPAAAAALVARSFVGPLAAGSALALAVALIFPALGLVAPLSLRFARARRQLRAWQANGEPPGESPSDDSLPTRADLVVGVSIGAVFSAALIAGVLLDH